MLPQPKTLRLIGLCRRAGKLAAGTEAALETLGRETLILIASDAGKSVRKQFASRALELPFDKAEIGGAIGRNTCAVLAILDKNFIDGILESLEVT